MSTFSGLFNEIPCISADRFEFQNLKVSKVFFLSHCHTDHMVGLKDCLSLPGPLYTSAISAVFLRHQFPNISPSIKILDINDPEEIVFLGFNEEEYKLTVTVLPAHHCPGSIMLLFETNNKCVLYTGDFRLTKSDLEKMGELKDKIVDVIYLDSTFLDKNFYEFPTQLESINEICHLVREWLTKDKKCKVILELPANYGPEYLFMEIARKLEQKVYVNPLQYRKYSYISEMDRCLSEDLKECKIIAIIKRSYKSVMNYDFSEENIKYRTILPSAIYWVNWHRNKPMKVKENDEVFRVAYSNHSGLKEITEFLYFFKPTEVKLNVVPENRFHKMYELLEEIYPSKRNPKDITTRKEITQNEESYKNIYLTSGKRLKFDRKEAISLLPKRKKW